MNSFDETKPLFTLTIGEYLELNRRIYLETFANTLKRNDENEILTIDQVSKLINLAKPTIYGMTSKNTIPFIKMNKKILFQKSAVMEWLEQGKQKF